MMVVSLSQGLRSAFGSIFGSAEEARKQIRAAQIEDMYQQAVQQVFKAAAPLVLKHTNAVYCFEEKGTAQFVVYADDGSIRASLDARQELLKIDLFKQGLRYSSFKALPAQKSIKARHPFDAVVAQPIAPIMREITPQERRQAQEFVSSVEDLGVREALMQAVISDMRTHKA